MLKIKRKNKRRSIALALMGMVGLGVGFNFFGKPLTAHADNVPQSVDVKKASSRDVNYTYSEGYRTTEASGIGAHFVDTIKDTDGNYLFCVQWSKNAPSNTRIAAKVQAQPAVTWLLNDYEKGSKRYQSLGKGDEGDYWLYQAVIHWITQPNDDDSANGYNIQHYINNSSVVAPSVKTKLEALRKKALKQASEGTTDEVLNTHAMSFDPDSLKLDGSNLTGDTYSKIFTFKSTSMSNVKIWLDGQPTGTTLSGSGVDMNNVKNAAKITVKMPYKNVTTASKTFHVKAKGDWDKKMKVAYIYGDTDNTNQNIAKQVVKATTVPLDITANMDVTVAPALGKITFVKKGSANKNGQILPGTKFSITGTRFSKTFAADSNGKVEMTDLPLGIDYEIKETSQPNKFYTGDLSSYTTKVTALNGSHPSRTATAFGGTLINSQTHVDAELFKKDVNSKVIAGAKFIIIQVNKGAGLKVSSLAQAKTMAMHKSGDEIVAGDNGGNPLIITSGSNGKAVFDLVAFNSDKYDYYAVEVGAPSKYGLAPESTKLSLDPTGANTQDFSIKDDVKTAIPATGSHEIAYYEIAIGVVLTLVAAVLFIVKPFREQSK